MRERVIEEFKHAGFTVRILQDPDPESPREWDNLGTMVCWHRRYNLGDEQPQSDPMDWIVDLAYEFCAPDDLCSMDFAKQFEKISHQETVEACLEMLHEKGVVILPLYLFDHSGISMSTRDFGDRWDSGQVGWIYCSLAKAKKERPDATEKMVRERLIGEVETYDQYLRGDIYGYTVEDDENNVVDSCWGCYDFDETIKDAKTSAEYFATKSGGK